MVLFLTSCAHKPMEGTGGAAPGGGVAAAVKQQATFTKPVFFSILQDYVKGEDLQQVALDFDLMRELGVTPGGGVLPGEIWSRPWRNMIRTGCIALPTLPTSTASSFAPASAR